jgi:hypothetical protein
MNKHVTETMGSSAIIRNGSEMRLRRPACFCDVVDDRSVESFSAASCKVSGSIQTVKRANSADPPLIQKLMSHRVGQRLLTKIEEVDATSGPKVVVTISQVLASPREAGLGKMSAIMPLVTIMAAVEPAPAINRNTNKDAQFGAPTAAQVKVATRAAEEIIHHRLP